MKGSKKEIATIVAERTATEKDIATQQELTKDIHVKSESERNKLVTLQLAEANSQSVAIEKTTIAKAELDATKSLVEKDSMLAENRLVVATKDAEGKQKIAQAVRVEKERQKVLHRLMLSKNTGSSNATSRSY